MLFEAEDVPRLVSFETDEEETTFEEDEMDFLLFTRLSDAREVMFSLIYAESVPVDLMLKIIEDFGEDLQSCIDEEREYEMDEVIDGYREKVAQCIKHYGTVDKGAGFSERLWIDQRDADGSRTDSGKSGNLWTDDDAGRDDLNDRTSGPGRFESRMEEFRVLTSLELLRPEWGELLLDVLDRLYSEGEEAYLEKVETFERTWGSRAEDPFVRNRWSLICRKLMFFFIHTYFCGAVYDAWPAAKTRMAAFSVRWIMELLMYRFHANGGVLTDRDVIEMAWRYAREVEHSDQNRDILDEALDRAKEET